MKTLSEKDLKFLKRLFMMEKWWVKDYGFVVEATSPLQMTCFHSELSSKRFNYQSFFRVNENKVQFIIKKYPPKNLIKKLIYNACTNIANLLINIRCSL